MKRRIVLPGLLSIWGTGALADKADVLDATIKCDGDTCYISATVKHADTGWEHYADAWRVLTPAGKEIGKRVLYHPHENEQPFTRSLGGVKIPSGIDHVLIEAHDNVHGWGEKQFKLTLP